MNAYVVFAHPTRQSFSGSVLEALYGVPGETFPFRRLAVDRALVLCSAGNTAGILEQSGVAQSMKRIYTNDRLHPGSGVGQCEVVLLPGMADPQTAPQARGRNLDTAYRLGRYFLTAAPEYLHRRTR